MALFREAATFLLDNVYTRICDLQCNSEVFGADLYYHSSCLSGCILKYQRLKSTASKSNSQKTRKRDVFNKYLQFIKDVVIDRGSAISLSQIRGMVNEKDDINIHNVEVKDFLENAFENIIQFCSSARLNESLFLFSSTISIQDVVKKLRSVNATRDGAKTIRKSLLNLDFRLNDKFCDAEELKTSWRKTVMPDELITFLVTLFPVHEATLLPRYFNTDESADQDLAENDDENKIEEKSEPIQTSKIMALCQIIFYNVHHTRVSIA